MPRMANKLAALGANATSANQLAGLLHEFVRYPRAAIRVMATSSATGINCTFVIGTEAIVQDQFISLANRFPVIPDDEVCTHGALRGERLFLTFRNTTAGALDIFWVVDVKAI